MSKKRYQNAVIITMDDANPYIANGYLDVDGANITALGDMQSAPPAPGAEIVDLAGHVLMPGFISAHCHFYGQFVRGMPLSQPLETWQQILSRMWWKVDRKLTEEQVYYSTLLGLVDGLKSGTTTYFDHHVSASCIPGSLDIIEKGMREAGARGALCYEVSDRYGAEGAKQGIAENVRYAQKSASDPVLRGMMGLHAGYTVGDETLAACVAAEKPLNCGFHIHVAEAMADVTHSYENYDEHIADRLHNAGIFGPKTITAHGTYFRPKDWPVLKKTGTTVAHNCQSNMNNGVGCAPVVGMLGEGVKVALGGDGYTYNLFSELAIATIWQRGYNMDCTLFSGEEVKRFAFTNNQLLCKSIFGRDIGILKPGAAADFLRVAYDAPTPMTKDNWLSHLSSFSGNVKDVVIEGKTVVENGKCQTLDEAAVMAECRKSSQALWDSLH